MERVIFAPSYPDLPYLTLVMFGCADVSYSVYVYHLYIFPRVTLLVCVLKCMRITVLL